MPVTGNLKDLPFRERLPGNPKTEEADENLRIDFADLNKFNFNQMKKAWHYYILLLFGALCLLNFSAAAQNGTENSQNKISENDLIHSGDLIDVDILGSSEFDWRGTLTPEGNLAGLDFIEESVYALCKNVEEVEKNVAAAYSKLLRDPKVKVTILDRSNRPLATVFGAVKSQQRFQIKRPVLLNELLVLAGGFTDKSSGVIQIFRSKGLTCGKNETFKLENDTIAERSVQTSQGKAAETLKFSVSDLLTGKYNPQILTGDIVTVLEANPIYVTGGVNSPKTISSREKLTLSRAISSAGGFAKDAEVNDVIIFRRDGASTKIIEIEYGKITAGGEDDPVLQDFDIIEVGVKGRSKNKFPPIIEKVDLTPKPLSSLPLRIID